MPTPNVIYDLVKESEVSIDNTRTSFVRPGRIKDFVTTGDPATIMGRAIDSAGLPARFSAHPYYPFSTLQRYAFYTQAGVNDKIWFKLFYDTPEGRNPAGDSLFTLERHRQLVAVQTQTHPKDRADLDVGWKDPNNPTNVVPKQPQIMTYLQPHLMMVATGYIIGEIPEQYETAYSTVNKTEWHGKPRGYWLYLGADDSTRDFGNSYTIKLSILTKVTEDWSQYDTLRDPRTGLFVPVGNLDALTLKQRQYEYDQKKLNGIIKVGFYDLSEFNDNFGF